MVGAMRLRATEVADVTEGTLSGPEVTVDGARIDSRLVRGGELFVALRAERDGHTYVDAALDAGAGACLVERPVERGTSIVVDDTFVALTQLATRMRDPLPDRVVGITGRAEER